LREELERSIPGAEKMNTGELTLYLRGSRDALKPFEEAWESLKTQLKPLPEHEPVILNHAK
jgi:hypothetical protein